MPSSQRHRPGNHLHVCCSAKATTLLSSLDAIHPVLSHVCLNFSYNVSIIFCVFILLRLACERHPTRRCWRLPGTAEGLAMVPVKLLAHHRCSWLARRASSRVSMPNTCECYESNFRVDLPFPQTGATTYPSLTISVRRLMLTVPTSSLLILAIA